MSWKPFPLRTGSTLYFPKGFGEGIFSVPAEGGSEKQVIGAGKADVWSVTERAIYYVEARSGPPSLMRFDIKTWVTTKLGPISNRIGWNSSPAICVSRDEHFLVYVERERAGSRLDDGGQLSVTISPGSRRIRPDLIW